jgi:hypothetical protein
MDDITGAASLTTIDIAALRRADRVCFVHRDRQSYIRAIKAIARSKANPFTDELEYRIECGTRFTSYEPNEGYFFPRPDFDAFEMEHNAQSSLQWQTIAGLLKPGDQLTLHWVRGAMNTLSADAINWVGDTLKLLVTRRDKHLCFHVDQSFVPRHSLARMIRNVRKHEPAPLQITQETP